MAVAVALWSIALQPGKTEVIPQGDLRITNAALGDELADASGRTSIKFTYETPMKMDDDDDDDDDDTEPLTTTVICSLTPGKIEQSVVDIVLEEDEVVVFEVVGKNTVYLTGNYIDQTPNDLPHADDYSEDDDEEESFRLEDISSDVEVGADELNSDEEDSGRFEEVEERASPAQKSLKRDADAMDTEEESKLTKSQRKKLKKLKAEGGKAVVVSAEAETKKANDEEKKRADEEKKGESEGKESKKDKKAKKVGEAGAVKELPGGLKIQDKTVGTGPQAKKGNMVSLRYIGKLENGTKFDSNTKGKPFKFHLGKGEVIKGWDEGIVGMQVGGERLLTVPPKLGYGSKKSGPIPPNSTLIFETKLLEIH